LASEFSGRLLRLLDMGFGTQAQLKSQAQVSGFRLQASQYSIRFHLGSQARAQALKLGLSFSKLKSVWLKRNLWLKFKHLKYKHGTGFRTCLRSQVSGTGVRRQVAMVSGHQVLNQVSGLRSQLSLSSFGASNSD